jgi:hypothetical protein
MMYILIQNQVVLVVMFRDDCRNKPLLVVIIMILLMKVFWKWQHHPMNLIYANLNITMQLFSYQRRLHHHRRHRHRHRNSNEKSRT